MIDFRNLVFTGRGSSALYAILKSLDVQKKNILLPVNICEIVYPIVIKAGFNPVFYDVNETDGNSRLINIIGKYTGNECVLLALHNFGAPLEIDLISDWAKKNKIFLIEDVCNSLGAVYKSKCVGLWGDAAIFSFGYAKILEVGVGGAAYIKDEILKKRVIELANSFEIYNKTHQEKNVYLQEKIRNIRSQNISDKEVYTNIYQDYINFLLYNINNETKDAIIKQGKSLEKNIEQRKQKAYRYRTEINSLDIKHIPEVNGQIYWRYNLLADPLKRDFIVKELRRKNILVSTWYPPIGGFFINNFPINEYIGAYMFGKSVINLFVDFRVNDDDVSCAIEIINSI